MPKIGFGLHSSVEDDARTRFPYLNKRAQSGDDGKRLLGITWKRAYHLTATVVSITRGRGRMAME